MFNFNINRFLPQMNRWNWQPPFPQRNQAQNNDLNFAQQIAAMCAGIPDGRIQNEARRLIQDIEARARQAEPRVPNRGVEIEEIVDEPVQNRPRQERVQNIAPRVEVPVNARNTLRATHEEIECNLAILKQSIMEGKAGSIDREFIKIIQDDIKALNAHPTVTRVQIANLRDICRECAVELFTAQERRL